MEGTDERVLVFAGSFSELSKSEIKSAQLEVRRRAAPRGGGNAIQVNLEPL